MRNLVAGIGLALCSLPALALDGGSFKLGETKLTPELQLLYFQDDNIYATQNDEVDDKGYQIKPMLEWQADKGLNSITATYNGEFASHSDETDLDYADHEFALFGKAEFSVRSRLSVVARHQIEHEDAGTGRSRDLSLDDRHELTEYTDTGISANYYYGARTAKGGLQFGLDNVSRSYKNNAAVTDGYSFNRIKPSFTFLYAISSDTRITSGIEYSMLDYEKTSRFTELDNNYYFAFVGANWDITGKSGGSAKIGYGGQNFDSNTRDDNNSTLFRVGTYWTPVEYSRFSLDLERDFALDTNTSSIRSFLNLGWRHTWSSRVATSANFILVDINSDDDTDDSTRETLSLEFIIKLRRWVDLNLIGKKTTNDANLDEYEYEKQWLGLGVTLRL